LQKCFNNRAIFRIIDANINRLKEGLRVCEEITRFILNNAALTSDFKKIRHSLDAAIKGLPDKLTLIDKRDTSKDIGRDICINELKRDNYRDIFLANIQRAKESMRVLEEFSKLINKKAALDFKKLRYLLYSTEKTAIKIIFSAK